MVLRRKSRWKIGGAAQANQDPMSLLYGEMRNWSPMEAYLTQGCVLLSCSAQQASILSRACFGQVILSAAASSATAAPRDAHLPARPPRILAVEALSGRLPFQLGLEEAFYLSYDLNCLRICVSSSKGPAALSHNEAWSRLRQQHPLFAQRYMGFSYLRDRHWVVRSGHQYGADFLAYRHHPELVHSEYAVLIVPEGEVQQRASTWADIHAMNRLCGSVSKALLLLHVVPLGNSLVVSGFKDYVVGAVQVQRWLPEEHRSDAATSISTEAVKPSALRNHQVPRESANLLERRDVCSCYECPVFLTCGHGSGQ